MSNIATKTNLYLAEFYTKNSDIRFAWVEAHNGDAVKSILAKKLPKVFGEIITCTWQSRVVPLKLSRPAYRFINDTERFEQDVLP